MKLRADFVSNSLIKIGCVVNNTRFYFTNRDNVSRLINRWDILLLISIGILLFFLGWAGQQMTTPYLLGDQLPMSLDPINLPFYALRTVIRMFIALFLSIIFTLMIGALAAKNRRAEQIIIPMMDVLQSVPVLSFFHIVC